MFCHFFRPRENLISDIVDTLVPCFVDDGLSLMDYLKQIAVVCECDIDTECIVCKGDQTIVMLCHKTTEESLLRLVAQVRLNHTYAQHCDKNVREDEIDLFSKLFYKKCCYRFAIL